MKSFNNSYGSLGILCLRNVLGFKLDMKVNSLGCKLFAWPWRFLWSPSDYSWIGAGNRWILQDAFKVLLCDQLWQPITLFILAQWAAGCNNKSLQGFLKQQREFLVILQLCTVLVIHTLDFLLKSKCISAYKLNMEIFDPQAGFMFNWSPFLFCCSCRAMACWA
jgi:hypothetical protein